MEEPAKKRVVYVNSYHQGFPPSDQITRGLGESLPVDSFELISFFMDTKRNPSESFIRQRAAELLDSVHTIKPDVLIISDDNAMKYLVEPYFQDDSQPIVFCGINWSIEKYDIAACNMTGTLEILPVKELMQTMKSQYPGMKKLLVLNENTTTSRKTQPILDTLLGNLGLEVRQELVDDFESWKAVFSEANESVDLIYVQTKGAIKGWNDQKAEEHVKEFTKIPVVTCEEFMMPFAVFGQTQLSEEQGEKAAEMAKKIMNGTDPLDIPVSRNQLSRLWINKELARKIEFDPDKELRRKAMIAQ